MLVLQRSNQIPKLPKDLVRPKIVAGVNALGRAGDRDSLTTFIQIIAQTLGPEALVRYVNQTEAIKRLAASQGIDILNLIKTEQEMAMDMQRKQQQYAQQSLVDQAGQLAGTPLMDASKDPDATDRINNISDALQAQPEPPPTE